ncbi:hypothetical protein FRC02_001723 [Tulasnella sp. 418]|nr:hypothetical protein FRC02_001723 [Tulasnella sp. 418]
MCITHAKRFYCGNIHTTSVTECAIRRRDGPSAQCQAVKSFDHVDPPACPFEWCLDRDPEDEKRLKKKSILEIAREEYEREKRARELAKKTKEAEEVLKVKEKEGLKMAPTPPLSV